MPRKPDTVWMVNARTGPDGWKGQLSVSGAGVLFRAEPAGLGETLVPLEDIKRVRRVRGSPVLELKLRTPNRLALEIMGFYFTKPPSMDSPEGVRVLKKHRAKSRAVTDLRRANLLKKDAVAAWVEDIEQARASSRGTARA
jgi:hypothetical protein